MPSASLTRRAMRLENEGADEQQEDHTSARRSRSRSRSQSPGREMRKSSAATARKSSVVKTSRANSQTDGQFSGGLGGKVAEIGKWIFDGTRNVAMVLIVLRLAALAYYVEYPRNNFWMHFDQKEACDKLTKLFNHQTSLAAIASYLTYTVAHNLALNFANISQLNLFIAELTVLNIIGTIMWVMPKVTKHLLTFTEPHSLFIIVLVHSFIEVLVKHFVSQFATAFESTVDRPNTRQPLRTRRSSSHTSVASQPANYSFVDVFSTKLFNLYNNLFALDNGDIEIRTASLVTVICYQIYVNNMHGHWYSDNSWLIGSAITMFHLIRAVKFGKKAQNQQTISSKNHAQFLESSQHPLPVFTHLTYLYQYLLFDVFYSNLTLHYAMTSNSAPKYGSMQLFSSMIILIATLAIYALVPDPLSQLNLNSKKGNRSFKLLMTRLLGPSVFAQIAIFTTTALMTGEVSMASLVLVDHIICHNFVELFILL